MKDGQRSKSTKVHLEKKTPLMGCHMLFLQILSKKKCPPILLTWAIETPTLLPPKSPDFHLFRPPRWRPHRCHGFFRAQMELAPTGSWWIYEPVDGSEIGPKKTPPFGDAFWNRSDVVGSYFTSTLKPLAFKRAENLQEWLSSLQLPTAEVVSWWGVKVGKGWANKVCGWLWWLGPFLPTMNFHSKHQLMSDQLKH